MSLTYSKLIPDGVGTWVHFVCRFIYYWCGLGDYWYEKRQTPLWGKICYLIWSFIDIGVFLAVIAAEVGALFREGLTTREMYDAIQFCIAHILIIFKWSCIIYHKPRIKQLLVKMLVETRELFVDEELERKQVRMAQRYCFVLGASMLGTMLFTTADGFVNYFITGTPWRTLVTYYPSEYDLSYSAYFIRGVTTLLWYHIVTAMCASDFLAITNLIYMSFKFRILQKYFRNLKIHFETNAMNKTQLELEDDMHNAFIKGIQQHKDIMWCAKNIQTSLGNVYSFQITQSVFLLVNCLAKLVTTPRTASNFLSVFSFILCMLVLTGVYMWSAGEITYQASFLGDAIFESGWHLCSARAKMRELVVVSIIRSHVPVIMTSFGVFDLSYENYIKIVRSSYSFFAVLY